MEQRQDITLGILFMGVGIAAALIARSYSGAGGAYPQVLGCVLALFGGIVAVRAARKGSTSERRLVEAPANLTKAIIASAIYVALVVPLGFYTASLLLMILLPVLLGFRQWRFGAAVAVIFVAIVFAGFSVLLEKPLPREALLPLLGLAN